MSWILIIFGVLLVGFAVYKMMFPGRRGDSDPQKRVDRIQGKYSTEHTRVEAWQETGAATARTEEASALGNEARAVKDMVDQQREVEEAQINREQTPGRMHRKEDLEKDAHEYQKARIRNEHRVTERATEQDIDPEVYLKAQEKRLLDELERLHQRQTAADEIRMTIIADLLKDHQRMSELQTLIDTTLIEIAELRKGKLRGVEVDSWAIPRMIASREESVTAWEADKRGIQQRLSQTDDGQNLRGTDSKAGLSGDKGETLAPGEVELPPPSPRRGSRGRGVNN